MLSTSKVEETYTVEDFIELGKEIDDIQYYKFSILAKATDDVENPILYAEHNVLYDYADELKKLSKIVVMTDEEYNKYKYKPKLLAYDLYGSTELYFVILFINGTCNVKDFDKRRINLIHKSTMTELLQSIYNAESNYITSNRAAIGYTE